MQKYSTSSVQPKPQPQQLQPYTIVTWLWGTKYSIQHVNNLYGMIKRNTTHSFRFICVTDRTALRKKFNPEIELIQLWQTLHNPRSGCWVRLKSFSEWARSIFGDRYLSIDVDVVITGNIDHILERDEPFILYKDMDERAVNNKYSCSMWVVNIGYLEKEIWQDFYTIVHNKCKGRVQLMWFLLRDKGFKGSDTGWICHVLHQLKLDIPTFSVEDGVYSLRCDFKDKNMIELPTDACMVMFHAKDNDPAFPHLQTMYPWIKDYYYD